MKEKQAAYHKSYRIALKPGTYWWCACGHSLSQPFCDGSHKATNIQPQELVIKKEKVYKICGCKESKAGPICDLTHRELF